MDNLVFTTEIVTIKGQKDFIKRQLAAWKFAKETMDQEAIELGGQAGFFYW